MTPPADTAEKQGSRGPWTHDDDDEAWIDVRDAMTEHDALSEYLGLEVGSNALENGLAIYVTGPHDTYYVNTTGEDEDADRLVNCEDWDTIPSGYEPVEVWHVRADHAGPIARRQGCIEGERAATERIVNWLTRIDRIGYINGLGQVTSMVAAAIERGEHLDSGTVER